MIEVETKIPIYEIDGVEAPIGKIETVSIKSHWNRNEFVIIVIPGTKDKQSIEVAVSASDLEKAVVNATNTR